MCGMRIAGGILAAGLLATAATASAPAVASQQPSGTPASPRPSETDTPVFTQPLPNVKGKTFTAVIVYFPPAARAAPHRHGSEFVYAYVLEGTVRSQLAGEPVRTYHQGQSWVELPGAHHLLTENTNLTKPAKLLVILSPTREPNSRSMITHSRALASSELVASEDYRQLPLRQLLKPGCDNCHARYRIRAEYARQNGHADLLRERIDGSIGQ